MEAGNEEREEDDKSDGGTKEKEDTEGVMRGRGNEEGGRKERESIFGEASAELHHLITTV